MLQKPEREKKSNGGRDSLLSDMLMCYMRQLMEVTVRVDEMQSLWPFTPEPTVVSGIKNLSGSLQLVSVIVDCWLISLLRIRWCEWLKMAEDAFTYVSLIEKG